MTSIQYGTLHIQQDGRSVFVRLICPVNRQTVTSIQHRLDGALRGRGRTFTLDLTSAEYLDSDGIRWLQSLQERLQGSDGELRLTVREGSRIDRTLRLLQLESAFTIDCQHPDSVDAAAPTTSELISI